MADWIKQQDLPVCFIQVDPLNIKTELVKSNRWGKINHINIYRKKTPMAVVIPSKMYFKARIVREKEHLSVIKGSIYQDTEP